MLRKVIAANSRNAIIVAVSIFAIFTIFNSANADPGINVYGYFSINYEDVGETPDGSDDPGEFSFPHLNLMFTSKISDQFRIYVNLAGDDAETVNVRNYWGEYIMWDYLKVRMGKIYRPFGLFNEKLDAVPTYLGIEPPELFDGDHLMLPRTGELMVHGNIPIGENILGYAVMTGNKEVIDTGKPVSWDVNYCFNNMVTVGTSGYYSKEMGSPIGVGEGSPPGGVLPWMAEDKYTVLGGYVQALWNNFIFKTAYWTADHDAVRDPNQVAELYDVGLNQSQMIRFGLDAYDPTNSSDVSMIDTDGAYKVNTFYIRLGYTIKSGIIPGFKCEITPFFFWDYYENEETIASKRYGGDNEAGLADDGKFTKPTIGIAFKPNSQVAFKIDASSHMYKWTDPHDLAAGSQDVHFEEIRFDFSYFFR